MTEPHKLRRLCISRPVAMDSSRIERRLSRVLASRFRILPAAGPLAFALLVSCKSPSPLAGQMSSGLVTLLAVPEKQFIRWPSIALRSDTVFVVANVFQGESLTVRPAYLGRLRQSARGDLVALAPLELPAGDFQFAYPRIIVAGSRLHLIWAEFGFRPRTTMAWQQASLLRKSLWHSALLDGVWSVPEKIATGEGLGWDDETGSVAVDASGTLHVAVWKGNTDSIPHVHDFRLDGVRWDSSRLPYTGLNPAAAIATRGDTTVLAAIAEAGDTARVMVLESTDHGKQWTNPVVVSSRLKVQGSVSHLALVRTANGLVLAIGEKSNDSFYLDTIRVLRLQGSRPLSTPQFVPPPPTADQFVMAGTSCGSIVILTRSLSAKPQIFQITIPPDSSRTVSRPLLDSAGFSAFPGITAAGQSVIAAFVYTPATNTPPRNAVMPLHVCSR